MKRLLAALAVVLVTGAAAEPPRRIGLTVAISTAGDHLHAHVHTDKPVAEIGFEDNQFPENEALVRAVQLRQWRPAGPGWLPFDARLARRDGAPFQEADLDLYPDDVPLGYADPLLFPAGGGFVLSSRYLLADPRRFEPSLVFKPRDGEFLDIGAPGLANLVQRDFTRAIYLGPADSLTGQNGIRLVAAADFPAEARRLILAGVKRSLAFYRDRIGLPLPWEPTVILAQLPAAPDQSHAGIIGKAVPGGVLTFRFFGAPALSGAEAARAGLDRVAAHEVFHFWDAFVGKPRGGAEAPWLYEGGAEYAALLARRDAGLLDDQAFYREIDRTLLICRKQLGTQGMERLPTAERYRLAYPCGMVIHFLSDMAIQHATRQQSGIFDLWRDLLIRAKGQGGFYSVEDFRQALAARDASALMGLNEMLAPDTGDRWIRLRNRLDSYGVATAPALQSETEARLAMFRLLVDLDCAKAGSWQLTEGLGGFQLYLGSRACQHFGPALEIRAVEGFSLFADSYEAHAAVQRKCAIGGTVDLSLSDTRSMGLVCTRPLAPLAYSPPDFVVRGLP